MEIVSNIGEFSTTGGTGALDLEGAIDQSFQTFAGDPDLTDGETVIIRVQNTDTISEWEVCEAVYNSGSPGNVARGTVIKSSNGNATVDFTVGDRLHIEVVAAGERAVTVDVPERLPEVAVTQHEGAIDHDALLNYLADQHRTVLIDTEGNRPAAGTSDRFFYATDTDRWFYDDGATWSALTMDAGDIDSGTLADARVPESAVTQHEAAVTAGALADDAWVSRLVDSPNGTPPIAELENGESVEITVVVPDTETLKVYRWGCYRIPEADTPVGLDVELLDGSDAVQASANTADNESTLASAPVASHQNTSGSASIFKLRVRNTTGGILNAAGHFAYVVE